MSIHCKIALSPSPEKKFHKIDYKVMKLAFNIHNELGNLWNEETYKNKLYQRASDAELYAAKEVQITLSHAGFVKHYYMDLIIENCIYELKTAKNIVNENTAQTLNYLFLTKYLNRTNFSHIHWINFDKANI